MEVNNRYAFYNAIKSLSLVGKVSFKVLSDNHDVCSLLEMNGTCDGDGEAMDMAKACTTKLYSKDSLSLQFDGDISLNKYLRDGSCVSKSIHMTKIGKDCSSIDNLLKLDYLVAGRNN